MTNEPPPRTGSSKAAPKRSSTASTPLLVALIALLCVAGVAYLSNYDYGGGDDTVAQPVTSLGDVTCTAAPSPSDSPPTFPEPPDPALAEEATWRATLATNCGDIILELYGDRAPQTVASFVFLAQQEFWVNSPCHRLTTGSIFVLQCGDPTGTGSAGPGYTFGIENAPANGSYPKGTVAMARSADPNSNGSQFFVVYADTSLPTEGGGYSIFGRVTSGLDIVEALAKRGVAGDATDGAPAQPISILGVSVQKA